MTIETYEKAKALNDRKLRIEELLRRVENRSNIGGLVEDACDSLIDAELHVECMGYLRDKLFLHLKSKLEATVIVFQELQ